MRWGKDNAGRSRSIYVACRCQRFHDTRLHRMNIVARTGCQHDYDNKSDPREPDRLMGCRQFLHLRTVVSGNVVVEHSHECFDDGVAAEGGGQLAVYVDWRDGLFERSRQ